MAALRTDHLAELNALRDQPAPGPTEGSVSVLLRSCPHCDVSFADVSSRTFTAKDKAQEKTLLKHLAVSPQMAALLRNSLPTVDTGQPAPTAAVSERPENEAPPEPEPA